MIQRLKYLFPILVFGAVAAIFFVPVFFQGRTFFAFDMLCTYLPWQGNGCPPTVNNSLITDPLNAFYPPLFYPAHAYFQSALAAGSLPLWYDANFCGTPFFPYSSPLFYLFYILFPLTTAHDLLLFFHLIGTGLLTYAYLRYIGLGKIPAVIGGLAWMFNGYVMVWFEFEHVPMLAFCLPLTLLFFEMWFDKPSGKVFVGIAAAIALTVCTSYAHLIIYQLIFAGVYLLAAAFRRRSSAEYPRKRLQRIAVAGVAIFIGLAVSAHFFTSHLIMLGHGQREAYRFEEIFKKTGRLQAPRLASLVFPDLFNSPVLKIVAIPGHKTDRPYNNYCELAIYGGVFVLFLAVSAIPYILRSRYIGFFLGVGILCLTMAMGSVLYYPFWRFVPGLNLSTPTRILYIFGFCLAMLAALGADRLADSCADRKGLLIGLWALVWSAALGLVAFTQTEAGIRWISSIEGIQLEPEKLQMLAPVFSPASPIFIGPLVLTTVSFLLLLVLVFSKDGSYRNVLLGLGAVLIVIDLVPFGLSFNTAAPRRMEFPKTPGIQFLQSRPGLFRIMASTYFMPNGMVAFGFEDVGGYGSQLSRRYAEFIRISQNRGKKLRKKRLGRWILMKKFGSPLLDLINTRYILVRPENEMNHPSLRLVYNGEMRIYENTRALPRAFFVPNARWVAGPEEAYRLLDGFSTGDFRQTVILEDVPDGIHPPHAERPATGGNADVGVRIVSHKMNRVEIRIDSPRSGFLVLGDSYAPGWSAVVDGAPVKIYRADYILRAVQVPAGSHRVVFSYRPRLLLAGLFTTWAGWIVLAFAALVVWFRGRSTQSPLKMRLPRKSLDLRVKGF